MLGFAGMSSKYRNSTDINQGVYILSEVYVKSNFLLLFLECSCIGITGFKKLGSAGTSSKHKNGSDIKTRVYVFCRRFTLNQASCCYLLSVGVLESLVLRCWFHKYKHQQRYKNWGMHILSKVYIKSSFMLLFVECQCIGVTGFKTLRFAST